MLLWERGVKKDLYLPFLPKELKKALLVFFLNEAFCSPVTRPPALSLCPLCTMGQWGDLHRQHSCGLGPSHPCFVHGAGREVAPRGHTGQDVTCHSHPSSSEGQELPALLLLSPVPLLGRAEGRSSVPAWLLCTRECKAECSVPRDGCLASFHCSDTLPSPPRLSGGAETREEPWQSHGQVSV